MYYLGRQGGKSWIGGRWMGDGEGAVSYLHMDTTTPTPTPTTQLLGLVGLDHRWV